MEAEIGKDLSESVISSYNFNMVQKDIRYDKAAKYASAIYWSVDKKFDRLSSLITLARIFSGSNI